MDPATYTVTVTATNSVTGQSSPPKTLTQVVALPTITIYQANSSKPTATTCDTVQFGVMAGGGCGNLTYGWDFGDGTTSTNSYPTHQYTAVSRASGSMVTLAIYDPDSGTLAIGTLRQVVTWPAMSLTSMTSSANPSIVNQSVVFSAQAAESCGGGTFTYAWVFGDGSTGTGASVTHQYAAASTGYTVQVTATDTASGLTATQTLTQVVNPYDGQPHLDLKADTTNLCAGGWYNGWNQAVDGQGPGYVYKDISQSSTTYVTRSGPDAHVTTLTATMTAADGSPVGGASVNFSWQMPCSDADGNDANQSETRTATTGANGKATVNVVSGNEVANSVVITAVCSGVTQTSTVNVTGPNATWLFQDSTGAWQTWDGTLLALQENANTAAPISLRSVYTFGTDAQGNPVPVVGHCISWQITSVVDEGGQTLTPDSNGQYPGWGQFSGQYSTTGVNGIATATITVGYNGGDVTVEEDDCNIWDLAP